MSVLYLSTYVYRYIYISILYAYMNMHFDYTWTTNLYKNTWIPIRLLQVNFQCCNNTGPSPSSLKFLSVRQYCIQKTRLKLMRNLPFNTFYMNLSHIVSISKWFYHSKSFKIELIGFLILKIPKISSFRQKTVFLN